MILKKKCSQIQIHEYHMGPGCSVSLLQPPIQINGSLTDNNDELMEVYSFESGAGKHLERVKFHSILGHIVTMATVKGTFIYFLS